MAELRLVKVLGDFAAIDAGSVTGVLTVGTAPTQVKVGASPLTGRSAVLIVNNSAQDIFVGFDDSVTVDTGIPITAGTERTFILNPHKTVELYAVANTPTTVRVAEFKASDV